MFKKENINQIQTERSIKVYPNPSDGEFQLELYGEFENIIKIQISDQNGIEVYNSEFSSNSSTINVDLKELSSGAYIINIIENGKNIIQENLIINK